MMDYQDMVAIGSNLNAAIERTLDEYEITISESGVLDKGKLIGAIATAILVQLDQAGYKIERK